MKKMNSPQTPYEIKKYKSKTYFLTHEQKVKSLTL